MVDKKTTKTKKPTQKNYEKRVVELAKEGLTAEKIGLKLKEEGIHPKEFSKKISKVLKENDSYVNPDLKNVEKKVERIKKHRETNQQDKKARREVDKIYAQLRKLRKYFGISKPKK